MGLQKSKNLFSNINFSRATRQKKRGRPLQIVPILFCILSFTSSRYAPSSHLSFGFLAAVVSSSLLIRERTGA